MSTAAQVARRWLGRALPGSPVRLRVTRRFYVERFWGSTHWVHGTLFVRESWCGPDDRRPRLSLPWLFGNLVLMEKQ